MSETRITSETTVVIVGDTRAMVDEPSGGWHRLARQLGYWAQVAFLVAYIGVLSGAMFYFQFGLGEFPCPLCITQRMGMMLSSLGALFILVNALRGKLTPSLFMTGLGLAILGALLGATMSIRQILLHITPGDPGYGGEVFGFHLYTWALISFVVVLVFAGLLLTFGTEFMPLAPQARFARVITWIVIWVFILTVAANLLAVFALEGFNWFLPDDPTSYQLFG